MKKIILITILFIFSLSSVYAKDENNIISIQNKNIEKKINEIWNKLEKITLTYSNEKKRKTYYKYLLEINNYKKQKLSQNKKNIIDGLVIKLEKSIKKLIKVLDRTKDFYKTSIQENTYSCEISATSDIISTIKNKNISENELIKQINKSWFNKTAKYSNGIYIWGNPNEGYVGYIDKDGKGNIASQRNLTGYGVYEKPIELLYKNYDIKTKIINNSQYKKDFGPKQHLKMILEEFSRGNYIQLWGDICTTFKNDDGELKLGEITQEDVNNGKNAKNYCWSFGQDRKRIWYYEKDGKLIKHQGLIGEHNFYLLGYEGEIENPINIIIWDTSTGKHIYPIDEWLRKWEEMDYRSIIIYKNK